MALATIIADRIAYDKAAIMRLAYAEGRFALAMCRTPDARRRQLSNWLRKAWQAAKMEAADLIRHERQKAAALAYVETLKRNGAALAAAFGNDAAAIRWEIEREHYRQHFNPARIDALRGALASIGA